MKWNSENTAKLNQLISVYGTKWKKVSEKMTEHFSQEFTSSSVKNKYQHLQKIETDNVESESWKTNPDNTITSDKVLELNKERINDRVYLLEKHGFDSNEWEITSARSSQWNAQSRKDGVILMYASKITVKPKAISLNMDKLIDAIKETQPLFIVKESKEESNGEYLNIPLFDMHFGISDYKMYKTTQRKILALIKKNRYKGILFITGSDQFHHNDNRNRTARGHEIEHADMVLAWKDAIKFYEPLYATALEHAETVNSLFVKGNHSETLDWLFSERMSVRFPEVKFNNDFVERKTIMLGKNMIATTHGDKGFRNYPQLFATEFSREWAGATSREVYTGHLHFEKTIDHGGIIHRQLGTGNKLDSWHKDMGFSMAHRQFQVFEYTETKTKAIYFV